MADTNLRWNGVDLEKVFLKRDEEYLIPSHLNPSQLYLTGNNSSGELGDNTTISQSSPIQIASDKKWLSIIAAGTHTIGITTDTAVWGWGQNQFFQLGGNSQNVSRSSPIQVADNNVVGLIGFKKIFTSSNIVFGIKTDGSLWSWGQTNDGSLGRDVGGGTQLTPGQIGLLTNWYKVAPGTHCLALKTDGTLWAWGRNNFGQLGQNNIINRSSPVQIGTDSDWEDVAAGSSLSFALKKNGTLWAWGDNQFGALGQNNRINRSSPVQVGTLTDWKKLPQHMNTPQFIVAIKTNETLWGWGLNSNFQLGLGDTASRSSPVQIGALTNWSKVFLNSTVCHSIKTDGTLWVWGTQTSGEFGNNTTNNSSSPIQIGSLTNWKFVGKGNEHTALTTY